MSQAQLWMTYDLDCGGPGATPRPTLSNAVKVLEHDPTLCATLWYDEFLDRVMTGTPPREWRDADDLNLTVDLQDRVGIAAIPTRIVADAVQQYAHRRPRHLVRDWLTSLVWDGEPRVALAFEEHWGVECGESQPCDYVRAISQNFFVGLVARVMKPGCQLDTMVVFEGEQGTRKTSALRVIGGAHYAAVHESVTSKDFFQALQGKWLVEIGELDSFTRAEVTRVKMVISTPVDTYRASYGRRVNDYPRQCMFAGTTNATEWGSDETGLRRFWPARCGEVNLATLGAARDQLFAEAVRLYGDGEAWWVVPDAASRVQADRQQEHVWAELVLPGLIGQSETTTGYVLGHLLKHDAHQMTRVAELTVGKILRTAGWVKRPARRDGKMRKVWFAPEDR